MIDRVRYTCILRDRLVSEVELAFSVACDVLKKSVALDCVVDIRLGFLVEVDDLCVAAALKVEDTVVVPAMLVVADEESLRVCGKSCLACAGKTEEDSCVLAFHICVCGAMHGSNALQRQIVVHH